MNFEMHLSAVARIRYLHRLLNNPQPGTHRTTRALTQVEPVTIVNDVDDSLFVLAVHFHLKHIFLPILGKGMLDDIFYKYLYEHGRNNSGLQNIVGRDIQTKD